MVDATASELCFDVDNMTLEQLRKQLKAVGVDCLMNKREATTEFRYRFDKNFSGVATSVNLAGPNSTDVVLHSRYFPDKGQYRACHGTLYYLEEGGAQNSPARWFVYRQREAV